MSSPLRLVSLDDPTDLAVLAAERLGQALATDPDGELPRR